MYISVILNWCNCSIIWLPIYTVNKEGKDPYLFPSEPSILRTWLSAFHIVDSMNNYLLEECLVAFHVYVFLSAQLD